MKRGSDTYRMRFFNFINPSSMTHCEIKLWSRKSNLACQYEME